MFSLQLYFAYQNNIHIFQDWIPNNKSIIIAQEFQSPRHLAEYLHFLSENSTAYNEHLQHKLNTQIDNKVMVENYQKYRKKIKGETFISEFECIICLKIHNKEQGTGNKSHFNCPPPVSILDNKYNSSNWWHQDYFTSKCAADLLRSFIDRNIPLNKMRYDC